MCAKISIFTSQQPQDMLKIRCKNLNKKLECKGFQKIQLEPGQSEEVTFTISNEDLKFYRKDMSYGSEPGEFMIFVGGNSRDTQSAEFVLE